MRVSQRERVNEGKHQIFTFLYVRAQLGEPFACWVPMSLFIYSRVEQNKRAFRKVYDIRCYANSRRVILKKNIKFSRFCTCARS